METPEFFDFDARHSSENNNFVVDDLLDFPNDDSLGIEAAMTGLSTDSCNSSSANPPPPPTHFQPAAADIAGPAPFSNDLSVPYDELAELEWLSNFVVEESFSSEDQQKLQLIQGMKARPYHESSQTHLYQFQSEPVRQGPIFHSEMPVPAKARSKRSRAAPGNWTSRLLAVSSNPNSVGPTAAISSSSESEIGGKKPVKAAGQKIKKEMAENSGGSGGGEGRKCLHCATDKTPQWRTGPMGPKTLCNACGVRYKSGRLVPEYRPAASPTFVLTKHSNSHRKVLELRRQKEMIRAQQQQNHHHQFLQHHHHHHHLHHHQSMLFDVSSSNGADDYLIHQHIGPDFRQLI